jgi:hypothetical protein
MAFGKHPGPMGRHDHESDQGTLVRGRSPSPGPLGHLEHDHRQSQKSRLKWKVAIRAGDGARHNPAGLVWKRPSDPDYLWLYDFPVGSPVLGSAHKEALAQFARSSLNKTPDKWYVQIEGMTSTTASETKNVDLSDKRAWAVEERLRASLHGFTIKMKGSGESRAAEAGEPDNKENPVWRATEVQFLFIDKPIPPPPPPPRPPLEKASGGGTKKKRFWIHSVGGYSISVGPGGFVSFTLDFITFKIIDEQGKRIGTYKYGAKGVSVGKGVADLAKPEKLLKKLLKRFSPIQPTFYVANTKWSHFDVDQDWTLEQIIGEAHLLGYGINVPGSSLTGLSLPGRTDLTFSRAKNWHHFDSQTIPDIDLGIAIQLPTIGAGITSGQFFLDGDPEPYKGPFPPE